MQEAAIAAVIPSPKAQTGMAAGKCGVRGGTGGPFGGTRDGGGHSALRRERHMAPKASSTRDGTPVGAFAVVRSEELRGKALLGRRSGG
jgi:hypothetical protein